MTEQLKKWLEKRERKLSWVCIEEAIGLIEEPGVVPLLRRLMELAGSLGSQNEHLSETLSDGQFR